MSLRTKFGSVIDKRQEFVYAIVISEKEVSEEDWITGEIRTGIAQVEESVAFRSKVDRDAFVAQFNPSEWASKDRKAIAVSARPACDKPGSTPRDAQRSRELLKKREAENANNVAYVLIHTKVPTIVLDPSGRPYDNTFDYQTEYKAFSDLAARNAFINEFFAEDISYVPRNTKATAISAIPVSDFAIPARERENALNKLANN